MFFAHLAGDYASNDDVVRLDARFNHWLDHEAWTPLVELFQLVTVAGGTVFLLAVTVTAATLFRLRGLGAEAGLLLVAFAGAQLIVLAFKPVFERPRPPFHDPSLTLDSFSFPSGHATVSVAVYGALAFVLLRDLRSRRARTAMLVAVFSLLALIGFSRIYLGAHYLTDVLAGYSLGIAWLMVSDLAVTIRKRRAGRGGGAGPRRPGRDAAPAPP